MNRVYNYIVPLLLLALGGCASSDRPAKRDRKDEVPQLRYGISIEGYELRECEVKSGESIGSIMSSNGRSAADIDRVDRASQGVFSLRSVRAGGQYTLFLRSDSSGVNRLDYIAYEQDPLNYVLFVMKEDSVSVNIGVKPSVDLRQRRVAVIDSSLSKSITARGMPYSLGVEIENIYKWSVDLFRLQRGDSITVLYTERFVEDTISVGVREILGVKFKHGGRDRYAIPFDQGTGVEFWNKSGESLQRQMLKSPLRYSRMASRQSNIDNQDSLVAQYAVPTGSPVYSVAKGVVVVSAEGERGGNLRIRHDGGIESDYRPLGRFARGVVKGSRVEQGALIGYVGASEDGSASPYLEYRVWENGVAIDPLDAPRRGVKRISNENTAAFEIVSASVVLELDGE